MAGCWSRYFTHLVCQKETADSWVTEGLSSYLTGLFVQRNLGNNIYLFQLDKVVYLSRADRLPVCLSGDLHGPLYSSSRVFIRPTKGFVS
jgi:hypothetical protein